MKPLKEKRFEVITYDGRGMSCRSLSHMEANAIRPDEFDLFLSETKGVLGFRDGKGRWVEHHNDWPGLGDVCLDILKSLLLNAGDYLTPKDLVQATNRESLRENGNVAARICAIRKVLHDSTSRFIETRTAGGYAVRWKDRPWAWLERIPQAD